MNLLKNSVFVALFFFQCAVGLAQETLDTKYQDLLEKSETFNQYKVITKTSLDAFWSEVMDSLSSNGRVIQELRNLNKNQGVAIDTLTVARSSIKDRLDASLVSNDSIDFVGISFTKTSYHIMVWLIILVLVVVGFAVYLMYLRSHKVTIKANKDLESVQLAFKEHQDKSRDKVVKLKRELQTAVNALEDARRTSTK